MRIMTLSNAPWTSTGYGNQTRVFTPRLKALGHEIAITAFYGLEGAVLHWNGMPIYPRAQHPYGQDVMAAHATHFRADVLISLMDAWVVEPRMLIGGVRWAPWFPVDMDPLPPPVKNTVSQAFARIVYSKFGERMVHQAGLDCHYVPHGVETEVFKPTSKSEAREALKVPADAFIVGMVAANKGNPSRKAFTQQIEAFARFHQKHSDSLLYLHTSKSENGEHQGINLVEFCSYHDLQVGRDVVFADQYSQVLGFPDAYMVNAYNAMDVLLSASMGEGFGIPILEAQSCGTPVIVGGWTAMPELAFAGWTVPETAADRYWTPLGAYQWVPRVGAIEDRLRAAYHEGKSEKLQTIARQGALAYDADRVTREYWVPVLDAIEERIGLAKKAAETVRADWMARA